MIDQEHHLTPDMVDSMAIRAVKSHLMRFCEFSETDVQAFFSLFYLAPARISKIYHTGIVVLRQSKTVNEEAMARILIACIVKASKDGPRTDQIVRALNKLTIQEPETSFIPCQDQE